MSDLIIGFFSALGGGTVTAIIMACLQINRERNLEEELAGAVEGAFIDFNPERPSSR